MIISTLNHLKTSTNRHNFICIAVSYAKIGLFIVTIVDISQSRVIFPHSQWPLIVKYNVLYCHLNTDLNYFMTSFTVKQQTMIPWGRPISSAQLSSALSMDSK